MHIHSHFLESLEWFFGTYHSLTFKIMTQWHHTSPPPAVFSNTRRSRQSMHDKNLNNDLSITPNIFNYCQYDFLEFNDKPIQFPSRKAMGKQHSKDWFTSILGNWVMATQITPTLVQHLHSECREWSIALVDENQCETALLAFMSILD